jgi:sugar lactone lactonase YvrE
MDSKGRLFVADRGNNRIQIFTQDGEWVDTWYQFSRISGIHIDPSNDMLYAIDSESDENYNPGGWRKGLRVGNARNGEVLYFIPEHVSTVRPSGMGGVGAMGEGVTADKDGNIYAGDVGVFKGMTRFVPVLIP